MSEIVLKSSHFSLKIAENCRPVSLTVGETGEECLLASPSLPLFAIEQARPFNNENKLAHPCKRTVYEASSIRREGDRLTIGFALTNYRAILALKETEDYVALSLAGFEVDEDAYPGLHMTTPPWESLRLLQLPLKARAKFGDWLNVYHDDRAAVALLATSPAIAIENEAREGGRIFSATLPQNAPNMNGNAPCAVLIAGTPADLLPCIDRMERDFDLLLGVQSRMDRAHLNASVYWTAEMLTEDSLREHIAFASQGGFSMMLFYYTCFFKSDNGYDLCGDYDYHDHLAKGPEDVTKLLQMVRDAGITPGLHVLQTHIGMKSRYVTPVCDHRIALTRRFTLAKPISETDTVIEVEEDPTGTTMHPSCRLLRFGGELISYESYTTERPFRFIGCIRGAFDTRIRAHEAGLMGGILSVCEYGATSCYMDQNSSLPDEVSQKLADLYNAGFSFLYLDGSEGTGAPYAWQIPLSQYRLYQKLKEKPLFVEGAAKAHFSWHMLSGGNAFDVFPPPVFKEALDRYPAEEAPRMRADLTRINFGWWGYHLPCAAHDGLQPDHVEYGTSHAAAWDCPVTIQMNRYALSHHPRSDDNLEILRCWEEVRRNNALTEEQKRMLRIPGAEYTLIPDASGGDLLLPISPIPVSCAPHLTAYGIGSAHASGILFSLCHGTGQGCLAIPLPAGTLFAYDPETGAETELDPTSVPVSRRAYYLAHCEEGTLRDALDRARWC